MFMTSIADVVICRTLIDVVLTQRRLTQCEEE